MHICSNCGLALPENVKFCGSCGARSPVEEIILPASASTNTMQNPSPHRGSGSAGAAAPAPVPAIFRAPAREAFQGAGKIFERIKAGDFGKAALAARDWWLALQWPVRMAVVAVTLVLFTCLFGLAVGNDISPEGTILLTLVGIPIWFAALIALARPQPAPGWMWRFVQWSAMKRDRAREKGTFLGTWLFRPVYASFCRSSGWTAAINDPYLRTGLTFGLQILIVYAALVLAYLAIAVVVVLVLLVLAIWFIGWLLSQASDSGGSSYRYRSSSSSGAGWLLGGRSKERKDFWGNKYQQHYDQEGGKADRSEQREGSFGNKYEQHYDQDGNKTGRSEQRKGFFGNEYEQHYDQEDNKAGRTEQREGFLGDKYEQHYDQGGNEAGRSEQREDFLGNKYKEHKED